MLSFVMCALLVMIIGLSNAHAMVNDTICQGDSVTIGNTFPGTVWYLWSPGSYGNLSQITVAPTTTTTYIETDLNSLYVVIHKDTFNIVVKPKPTVWITSQGGVTTVCVGGGLPLTANSASSPISYLWSTGATTQQVTVFPVTSPTIYSVTGTSNGCSNSAAFTVYIQPSPIAYTITGDSTYCASQAGVLIGLNASEADCYYTLYKNGVAVQTINGTGFALSFGTQAYGTYSIKGFKNTLGCEAQMNGSLHVTTVPLPQAAGPIIGLTTVCQNSVMTYSTGIILYATSYDWSLPTGATIVSGQGTHVITVDFSSAISGLIKVRGHNACGDGLFTDTLVTVHQAPNLTVSANSTTICAGVTITLMATTTTNGCTFLWSNSLGTSSIVTASPMNDITYSVTVTDNNGCTTTGTIFITVHPVPVVTLHLVQNHFCPSQGPTLLLGGSPTGLGGTGIYSGTCVQPGDTVVPSSTAPSTYVITYTYTTQYGCSAAATDLAVFYAATPPIFLSINGPIYTDTPPFDLMPYVSPFGGTFSGPGTNTSNSMFNPAAAGAGTHQVFYTYTHPITGCTATQSQYINIGALGIGEIRLTVNAIGLFPNPVSNYVQLSGINTKEIVSLNVLDITGRLFYTNNALSKTMQIDLASFDPGIYIITFTSVNGISASKRFIKK